MTVHPDDTWVVVADAGRARIFRTDATFESLEQLEDVAHPAARLKTSELVTDQPGRTTTGSGKASMAHGDPHEHEELKAARALAHHLHDAHVQHRFRDLVLVASPVFLGRLRDELPAQTSRAVTATVHKDYVNRSPDDIRTLVKKQLESQPLTR